MGTLVISAKIGIGVLGAIVALVAASSDWLRGISAERFNAVAYGYAAASRLTLFLLVFVVLGFEASTDVPVYYYPQAQAALAGGLSDRDFTTSYAPLFPYVAACAVAIWGSPKSLILLAMLLEALSLPLWLATSRRAFGEPTARLAMVLYLTAPLPLVNVALDGQNQTYSALLLAASFALLVAERPFLSGLAGGLSVTAVKILGLVAVGGPFVGAGRHRGRWLLGGTLLPVVVYGGFAVAGADLVTPLRVESSASSSANLPYLLTALRINVWSGRSARFTTVAAGAALVGVMWWGARHSKAASPKGALHLTTLLSIVFMAFSKKSPTQYLVLAYFPLALTVAAGSPTKTVVAAFAFFGAAANAEGSLWARLLQPSDLSVLAQPDLRSRALLILVLDLVVLAGYAALGFRAVNELRQLGADSSGPERWGSPLK